MNFELDEHGIPGPWMVDRKTIVALRLSTAERELKAGRYGYALVEAEELLTEHPRNWKALRIAASSALKMGDATLACVCYEQLLTDFPEDPEVLSGLAIAHFGLADMQVSESLARKTLTVTTDNPQAWYCLALVLERTQRRDEAKKCFREANRICPESYPLPPALENALLDDALERAKQRLSPQAREFYARVPVTWAHFPDASALRATSPPLSPFVEALYEGTPPMNLDPWSDLPSAVHVFRGNLAWGSVDADSLADRIGLALNREAHHWLGLPPVAPVEASA